MKQPVESRLAAILAADGGLLTVDRDGRGWPAQALRDHRAATDPLIAQHGGRIVKTTGDGVLIEFGSVVGAVQCAIGLQRLAADDERPLSRNRGNSASFAGNFGRLRIVSSYRGARSLTERTMDDKEAYSSPIAAEAVGERFGSPPTNTGEHAVRPVATSAGPGARIADKTAESVGERASDAYADATTDEARERSRKAVRHAGMQGGSQAGPFNQQTFVAVVAAFALGYVAAWLINRSSY